MKRKLDRINKVIINKVKLKFFVANRVQTIKKHSNIE